MEHACSVKKKKKTTEGLGERNEITWEILLKTELNTVTLTLQNMLTIPFRIRDIIIMTNK